jgi:hypothetical protein
LADSLKPLLLLFVVSFATEREARAYVDPGSGALVWQLMVGGFVGFLFYFRRIGSWFKNRFKQKD